MYWMKTQRSYNETLWKSCHTLRCKIQFASYDPFSPYFWGDKKYYIENYSNRIRIPLCLQCIHSHGYYHSWKNQMIQRQRNSLRFVYKRIYFQNLTHRVCTLVQNICYSNHLTVITQNDVFLLVPKSKTLADPIPSLGCHPAFGPSRHRFHLLWTWLRDSHCAVQQSRFQLGATGRAGLRIHLVRTIWREPVWNEHEH